jgi:hypothetical protein
MHIMMLPMVEDGVCSICMLLAEKKYRRRRQGQSPAQLAERDSVPITDVDMTPGGPAAEWNNCCSCSSNSFSFSLVDGEEVIASSVQPRKYPKLLFPIPSYLIAKTANQPDFHCKFKAPRNGSPPFPSQIPRSSGSVTGI